MKKWLVLISVFMLIGTGAICYHLKQMSTDKSTSVYSIDQFSNLEIDKSTIDDVNVIAPISHLTVTSYGGVTEYPSAEGKWIQIKFYGKDLVVFSIEVVDSP